jgi:WD40 repeat protein
MFLLLLQSDDNHLLVSASSSGHLHIYDLQSSKINQVSSSPLAFLAPFYAHHSTICGCECVRGMSLIITNSDDNSLKVFF